MYKIYCQRKTAAKYREKNKDNVKLTSARYREKYKDLLKLKSAAYWKKNKEKMHETHMKYKNNNKEKYQMYRIQHKARYTHFKCTAKARKLIVNLNYDQYKEFICKPCFYCGKESSTIQTNGLDRVNNNIGYLIDNVVSCCLYCNRAKNNSNKTDFIMRTIIIAYNYYHSDDVITPPTNLFNTGRTAYCRYRCNARRRGLIFNISKEWFNKERKGLCHYCKRPNANGIDRMNNEIGYTEENCVACCKTCNYMKSDRSVSVFIDHCEAIADYTNMDSVIYDDHYVLTPA